MVPHFLPKYGLTNIGIAGDTIQVSVLTSEFVKQSNPIPTIDILR